MRLQIDGLNLHHKFKISLKKPLGSSNSLANNMIKHPGDLALPFGLGLGAAGMQQGEQHARNVLEDETNKMNDMESSNQSSLSSLATEEEKRRHALGLQQQQQILGFAGEQEQRAKDYRTQLASSLTKSGQDFFSLENPGILEDLNSRGLFTSQTARDKAQADALKEIQMNNDQQLMNFDTSSFNNINDIRGTGLSALLGGDQSALDAALDLRKAGLQRSFDMADQERQRSFAQMLAARQSRDQLVSSILGLGGSLGAGALGKP